MFTKIQKKSITTDLFEAAIFHEKAFLLLSELTKSNFSDEKYLDASLYLSTIRNKYLIEEYEQEKLKNTVVAFFGMSVGSHAAITFILQSKANEVKIADPDHISATNLNRLKLGIKSISRKKIEEIKKELKKINPTIDVKTLSVTGFEDMQRFCSETKTDVIVDAVDDLQSKVNLRKIARKLKIPLIMTTDVGENIFIDVERHDLKTETPFFHGKVRNIEKIEFDKLNLKERKKIILKILGFKDHSLRMLSSLSLIGKKLSTWPQLGSTAVIAGGLTTKAISKIVLNKKLNSGRYYFSTDKMFGEVADSVDNLKLKELKKILVK